MKPPLRVVKAYSSLPINEFFVLKSLPLLRMPLISVPLIAEDAAWGAVSVHNFDIHKGGLNSHFVDELDVTKWLQEVGKIAGSALYENKEKKSLHNIELYTMRWRSTKTGLIQHLLQSCMDVLVGCRVMEVWGMNKNLNLKNLGIYAYICVCKLFLLIYVC
jgi:hypothetical protein